MPHSITHGDACLAYFNKKRGIPLRDIAHVHINRKTDNWPDYFGALRNLIGKVISDSGLSAEEKALLARRISSRIEDLEKFW